MFSSFSNFNENKCTGQKKLDELNIPKLATYVSRKREKIDWYI